MKKLIKAVSVKELRSLNIKENDVLSFSFNDDNYYLNLNGKSILNFANGSLRLKAFNKIKKMGLGLGVINTPITDEEEGLVEANKNNENPFNYTIMS